MTYKMHKVLHVNKEKCINCHRCIEVCPLKFCNDGSGDYVEINDDMCVACGKCIKACSHKARVYIDDFEDFLQHIQKKEKVIAIVAPSIASNFPSKYLKINSWLISIGVSAVFDVSFGAELATKSIIDYFEHHTPNTTIANPCPAIVSYIQIYQPKLIPYLLPIDSPMVHLMKMIRHFHPEYSTHKIAVLSPCCAKKREYVETGLGDFNIAFQSLQNHFKTNNIDLDSFEDCAYSNPPAERAVLFPMPGGLTKTLDRKFKDMPGKTRKIEGTELIYNYLSSLESMIEKDKSPFFIDCLSCEQGCNSGPLTLNQDKSPDEIEHELHHRSNSAQLHQKGKIEKNIEKFWEKDLYKREYSDHSKNNILKQPSQSDIETIYQRMNKYAYKDIYNCSSCGYFTCKDMATAIFNNLNRPENCHHYLIAEEKKAKQRIKQTQEYLSNILQTSLEGFIRVDLDTRIIECNPSFERILCNPNLKGEYLTNLTDEEGKQVIQTQIKKRKSEQRSTYELTLYRPDRTPVYCCFNSSPLSEDGKVIGSFAMISDITESKMAHQKLLENNIHLEKLTTELNEKIEDITSLNEEIRQNLDELQSLNDDILLKKNIIESAHKDIKDSINYAQTIQESLLTNRDYISSHFQENFIIYQPKDVVSGDFYYVNQLDGNLIFAVADCTGHGVPGGFIMTLAVVYLHEIIKQTKLSDTGQILNTLRRKVKKTFSGFATHNANGLDIAICSINPQTNILHYSGANIPLIIIRNNELMVYKATSNPVGAYLKEKDFEQHEIKLHEGDAIYLYSDGYQDQFGGETNHKFTRRRFRELLFEIHQLPMDSQKQILESRMKQWRNEDRQTDDITVFGIRWITSNTAKKHTEATEIETFKVFNNN